MRALVVLALIAVARAEYTGFWRQGASNLIKERIDPIVARGRLPSGHAHMIAGGSALSPSSTTASLRKSKCTSSTTVGDYSLYWAPLLYFAWRNGSFTEVSGGMTQYYHTAPHSFPDDIHIVAGNPFATATSTDKVTAASFEWLCLDYGPGGTGTSRGRDWPMKNCNSGLRTQLNFPSCWDGKHLDSADHVSHMAYPIGGPDSRKCPSSHPTKIPQLFVELLFGIDEFKDDWQLAANTSWPFVWASGNESPYGLHADFIFGWDREIFDAANRKCISTASGQIQDNCKGLLALNKDADKCHVTPALDERVTGTIDRLAGCNPTFLTSYSPPVCKNQQDPKVLTPVTQYTGAAPPFGACALSGEAQVVKEAGGWGYQGCFGYKGARPSFTTSFNAGLTPAQCIAKCSAAGMTTCGIEYGGECRGSKAKVEANSLGSCDMPCTICGGPSSLSIYSKGKAIQGGTCKRVEASKSTSAQLAAVVSMSDSANDTSTVISTGSASDARLSRGLAATLAFLVAPLHGAFFL